MTEASHLGHREADGLVVDLFRDRRDPEARFRVVVEDRRECLRFVLYPTTGPEAIDAFYHPFAVAKGALDEEAAAA